MESLVKSDITVNYEIRRARTEDWPAILRLQTAERRPQRLDSRVSDYCVVIVGTELVACIGARCKSEIAYLYGLVVTKTWRRRGIGHAITTFCIDRLCDAGATRVFALAMFWNVAFFQKHGFSVTKRSLYHGLSGIHGDFTEEWCRRSALLCLVL